MSDTLLFVKINKIDKNLGIKTQQIHMFNYCNN